MIKSLLKHRFITASFWIFLSTGFLNVGNYLYHLLMGRMLGPSEYGILESAISFLYILMVPLLTITLVVIKFTSEYKGREDYSAIGGLYIYLRKKIFVFGIIGAVLLLISSQIIMSFLHLPSYIFIFLIALNFITGLFLVLGRSILQGMSHFLHFSISNILEVATKVILAVLLVMAGMKAEGAFMAVVIGGIAGYFVIFYFMQRLQLKGSKFTDQKKMLTYAIPVFFSSLATTSFFTTDIILVRHFFPGVESGYYAAASVLGKVIFFAVSPIMFVMFPLVSEHHAKGEKYTHYFLLSLGFTLAGSLFLTGIYFLFPELVVNALFGEKYLSVVPLLGLFSIFISLYSVANLIGNFYLSVHKIKAVYFMVIAAILQIVLIFFFHESLIQVIEMSIIALLLLIFAFLLYYPHATRR